MLTHILANGIRDGELPLAAQAIVGGEALPKELPDYGGTRVITAVQVPAIRSALDQIDDAEIKRRYELLDFTGTYGAGQDGGSSRPLELVLGYFSDLKDFYARAVADGSAVAIWYE